MSYLNDENILSLINASSQYGQTLDRTPSLNNTEQLSYLDFATILQDKGRIKPDDVNNEKFVLDYIYDEEFPERQRFIPLLSEQLPSYSTPESFDFGIGEKALAEPLVTITATAPALISGVVSDAFKLASAVNKFDFKTIRSFR